MTEETKPVDTSFSPPADDPNAMPAGYQQEPTSSDAREWRKFVIINYSLNVIGLFLLPFALLLRTGRWSTRMLNCIHRGWEFGEW